MNILFKNLKLLKQCTDSKEMEKAWEEKRAKKIALRLQAIKAAVVLDDLRNAHGHFHELTGDRRGQISCNLDGLYRLILEPADNPIPRKEDGGLDWKEVRTLLVIGVEDYHG